MRMLNVCRAEVGQGVGRYDGGAALAFRASSGQVVSSADCRYAHGQRWGVRESELGGRCARRWCGDWSRMRICVLEEEQDREEVERTKLRLYDHFLI
jgi:hypothetical protein